MYTSSYLFSLTCTFFLLIIPALPTASDFFSSSSADDDNLFSDEGIAISDSSSLFDAPSISTLPENILETEPLPPFLAESPPSSGCSSFFSNNNLQPLYRRGLILATRQPGGGGGGDRCLTSPSFKSQSESQPGSRNSGSFQNPNLDVERLGVIDNIQDYLCSQFVGWAFGSIPVCSVDDPEGVPSEEDLDEPDLLQVIQLSGYRNFVDCFLSKHIHPVKKLQTNYHHMS